MRERQRSQVEDSNSSFILDGVVGEHRWEVWTMRGFLKQAQSGTGIPSSSQAAQEDHKQDREAELNRVFSLSQRRQISEGVDHKWPRHACLVLSP